MARLTPESAWDFADAIKSIVKPQTNRRRATVQSVDKDGTIWVNLPGSSNVTPIQSTGANVSPGDEVLTELRGTSLHITENHTNPAIGAILARSIAQQETKHAEQMAKNAQTIADEAQAVAQATNQHFWDDENGAHVTDVTQDEWREALADEFPDYDPDTKPYHNQLLNSLGILLRTALNNLVSITKSAIAFYDGLGNESSNIVARFGSDGAQIGKDEANRLELGASYLKAYDSDGNLYFNMSPGGLTADQIDVNDDLRRALLQVSDLVIGDTGGAYINANGSHMAFMSGGNEVAYIDVDQDTGEAVFYMTRSIVVEDMQFGDGKWKWYKRDNNNMSLKWMG